MELFLLFLLNYLPKIMPGRTFKLLFLILEVGNNKKYLTEQKLAMFVYYIRVVTFWHTAAIFLYIGFTAIF